MKKKVFAKKNSPQQNSFNLPIQIHDVLSTRERFLGSSIFISFSFWLIYDQAATPKSHEKSFFSAQDHKAATEIIAQKHIKLKV